MVDTFEEFLRRTQQPHLNVDSGERSQAVCTQRLQSRADPYIQSKTNHFGLISPCAIPTKKHQTLFHMGGLPRHPLSHVPVESEKDRAHFITHRNNVTTTNLAAIELPPLVTARASGMPPSVKFFQVPIKFMSTVFAGGIVLGFLEQD